MVSPPKPWERTGAAAPSIASSTTADPTMPDSTLPALPDRPLALSSTAPLASTTAAPYSSPYNRFGLGSYGTGYGGYGGYGGMSGYNSFGSYGGIGSYGMGYGGMGYGGYGGMVPGQLPFGGAQPQFDVHGNPIPNLSLTQQLESTTHATFTLLHSIVQTFSGVAQMLESTFMATHSSFFAMVGVVEQFSHLRNAIGSVLGLFGLIRWLKDVVSGRHSAGEMGGEFRDFVNGQSVLPHNAPNTPGTPKPSKKPLIIFFLAIFGIPYAMHKLIRVLASRYPHHSNNQNLASLPPLDPSQLQFARALYPFQASNQNEVSLKQNEIVAIVAKLDPRSGMEVDPRISLVADGASGDAGEAEWWKGRTREGREGWFPRKWVEVLEKRTGEAKTVD